MLASDSRLSGVESVIGYSCSGGTTRQTNVGAAMPTDATKRKPTFESRFKAGEVVMVERSDMPMKIRMTEWKMHAGKLEPRYYDGDHWYVWESEVRPLTARERGKG